MDKQKDNETWLRMYGWANVCMYISRLCLLKAQKQWHLSDMSMPSTQILVCKQCSPIKGTNTARSA